MPRPIIGIPCCSNVAGGERGPVNGVFHSYVHAVSAAGGNPMLIPLGGRLEDAAALLELTDGILLTGGEDVDPARYGEEPHPTVRFSRERDELEAAVVRHAIDTGKPLLAICRGIQLVNVVLGGSLIQDLPSEGYSAVPHDLPRTPDSPEPLAHEIRIDPDSKLAAILETTSIQINSTHHQALKKLGTELRCTATAPDGVVEAVELPSHQFFVGIEGHPERVWEKIEPRWGRLFRAFVEESSRR